MIVKEIKKIVLGLILMFLLACGGAQEIHPRAVEHNDVGVVLLNQQDLDAAESRFWLAVEYGSHFPDPWVNLGIVAYMRGDYDEAEKRIRKAILIYEDFAIAWSNLGVVLEAKKEWKDANDAYEKALSIDPGMIDARQNLAILLFKTKHYEFARAHLRRLIELEPTNDDIFYLLAATEYRLNRKEEAQKVILKLEANKAKALAQESEMTEDDATQVVENRLDRLVDRILNRKKKSKNQQ